MATTRKLVNNSQMASIFRHLRSGKTLTPLEAMLLFGSMRLAARIKDLRDEGFQIETTIKEDVRGVKYAEYRMVA
jgi:hypothetical protein